MNFCGSARTDCAANRLAWSLIDPNPPKPPNAVMFWSAASPEDDEEAEFEPLDDVSVEKNKD